MKKEQFIKNLRYSLRKLKKDEREKYLAYYCLLYTSDAADE